MIWTTDLQRLSHGVSHGLGPVPVWCAPSRHLALTRYLLGGTTVHTVEGEQHDWLVGEYAHANLDRAAVLQWSSGTLRHESAHFRPTWALDGMVRRAAG